MGDVLCRVRADSVKTGDYLYLEDARMTVSILNIHRSGELLVLCWIGGFEYRMADELVCIEVMT